MMIQRLRQEIKENVKAKFFVFFSLLIIIVSISFTSFFIRHQRRSLTENLIREGSLLSQMLAYNSRLGVFSENEVLLEDAIEGILNHQDVLTVSIYLPDGTLLKQEKRKQDAKPQSPQKKEEIVSLIKGASTPFHRESGNEYCFWSPVNSGSNYVSMETDPEKSYVIGFVNVALDKNNLKQKLKTVLIKSTLIAIIFLVFSSILMYIVTTSITRPLNRLTAGVKALETGKEFVKVPIETEDEVGRLAAAFNHLAETLKRREAEKQHLEEQLRHAQKMEAIGTLAGGVAHDFNNFLTAIIGYGNLLQMGIPKTDRLRLYADQVMTAAERAANLTQRLLTFGRKQIMNLKPVYLNDILRSIDNLLKQLVGEDIEFSIGPVPPKTIIMADSGQIDQVLINLATNARDAMPRGGKLSIVTEVAEIDQETAGQYENVKAGRYARIIVADSGIGLDAKTMDRIFDPFFTTKDVGKGTGLGLSVVYGIIKEHSGFIDVKSNPGGGAVFAIYLPMIETIVEQINIVSPPLPHGKGELVLVAEDDAIVRAFTKELLEGHGYRVVEAGDGNEAVKTFINHRDEIDILLLDVIMPKMNGKDVFEEIKIMRPEIKALFISGYTYSIMSRKGIAGREINLISKPVQPGELLIKLQQTLQR